MTTGDEQALAAFLVRDRAFDGQFVVAVTTTRIFCRPSCPARRPLRENVRFFADLADAQGAGYRACLRCLPDRVLPDAAAVVAVRQLLEQAGGPVPLERLAQATGYLPSHLQRIFTRSVGVSPAAFGRALRLERARQSLKAGSSVTQAIYDAGYSGPSRFYADAGALGVRPSAIRRGGEGMIIRYAEILTAFGPLLAAATELGLCHLSFDLDLARLRERYPKAELVEDGAAPLIVAAAAAIADPALARCLSIDVPGTAFQQRVWAELRKIPPGETRSYLDLARALGDPNACRAVGGANGANPIAIIVPCHRVVRTDGTIGGYAGGLERKRRLLESEAAERQGLLPF